MLEAAKSKQLNSSIKNSSHAVDFRLYKAQPLQAHVTSIVGVWKESDSPETLGKFPRELIVA
jgi:hypothetical protein